MRATRAPLGGAEVEPVEAAAPSPAVVRVQGVAVVPLLHDGLAPAPGGRTVARVGPGPRARKPALLPRPLTVAGAGRTAGRAPAARRLPGEGRAVTGVAQVGAHEPGVVVAAHDGPLRGAHGVSAPAVGVGVRLSPAAAFGGVERRQETVECQDAKGARDAGAPVATGVAPPVVRPPFVLGLARVMQGHATPLGGVQGAVLPGQTAIGRAVRATAIADAVAGLVAGVVGPAPALGGHVVLVGYVAGLLVAAPLVGVAVVGRRPARGVPQARAHCGVVFPWASGYCLVVHW